METTTAHHSLFDLDRELDLLLEEIQEHAEENGEENIPPALIEQFQQFCDVFHQKVDRIGQFLIALDARATHCRSQSGRLADRARAAENKAARTKNMVLYYLQSRGLKKIEGLETTLRMQKNSQDSVIITNEALVPVEFREIGAKFPGALWRRVRNYLPEGDKQEFDGCMRQSLPSAAAIQAVRALDQEVPGTEIRRNYHIRVA